MTADGRVKHFTSSGLP